MKITLPASMVRAALSCVAKQKEIRFYLQGILLTPDRYVIGSNGHALFRAQYDEDEAAPQSNLIIKIHGAISRTAKTVTFDVAAEKMARGICYTDNDLAYVIEVLDGNYPDLNRIIPKGVREPFTNGFGINATYLAQAEKVFGPNSHLAIVHGTDSEIIEIRSTDEGKRGWQYLVMPLRLIKGSFLVSEKSKPREEE